MEIRDWTTGTPADLPPPGQGPGPEGPPSAYHDNDPSPSGIPDVFGRPGPATPDSQTLDHFLAPPRDEGQPLPPAGRGDAPAGGDGLWRLGNLLPAPVPAPRSGGRPRAKAR